MVSIRKLYVFYQHTRVLFMTYITFSFYGLQNFLDILTKSNTNFLGELKLVKMTAYQDYRDGYFWPNVTCQKISTSGTTLIDSTNRNFTTSWLGNATLRESM